MKVYLDNAATTPLAQEVLEVMLPFFNEKFGNPSSIHQYGREAKAAIEKARKNIAQMLNAAPAEICFTSGGTESANMILQGAVYNLGVKRIITSPIEHHCVLHSAQSLSEKVRIEYVELDEKGNMRYEHLEKLLADDTHKTLVCLMHANNEIGNITDIERVGALCSKFNAYFFSDTVQTVAHYPLDLQKIKVDFITGSAHKFHGPKGTGFVYMRSGILLKPILQGGSQERNLRAGTENITGIIGMEKAMSLCYSNLNEDMDYIQGLKSYLLQSIKTIMPDVAVNGNDKTESLYTVLNLTFPPKEHAEFLIYNLDMNGIAASTGSACSSGSDAGSHVLKALKIPADIGSVRFSFSRYNTIAELELVTEKIKEMFSVKVE